MGPSPNCIGLTDARCADSGVLVLLPYDEPNPSQGPKKVLGKRAIFDIFQVPLNGLKTAKFRIFAPPSPGCMSLTGATCVRMGARVLVMSPYDDPNPPERHRRFLENAKPSTHVRSRKLMHVTKKNAARQMRMGDVMQIEKVTRVRSTKLTRVVRPWPKPALCPCTRETNLQKILMCYVLCPRVSSVAHLDLHVVVQGIAVALVIEW